MRVTSTGHLTSLRLSLTSHLNKLLNTAPAAKLFKYLQTLQFWSQKLNKVHKIWRTLQCFFYWHGSNIQKQNNKRHEETSPKQYGMWPDPLPLTLLCWGGYFISMYVSVWNVWLIRQKSWRIKCVCLQRLFRTVGREKKTLKNKPVATVFDLMWLISQQWYTLCTGDSPCLLRQTSQKHRLRNLVYPINFFTAGSKVPTTGHFKTRSAFQEFLHHKSRF